MTRTNWTKIARTKFPSAEWVDGDGPFAFAAPCRWLTIQLFETEAEALAEDDRHQRVPCGDRCVLSQHSVFNLETGEQVI